MNLACPSCSTVYRIDPERVPEGGALTRCRQCDAPFHVPQHVAQAPGAVTTARRPTAVESAPAPPTSPGTVADGAPDDEAAAAPGPDTEPGGPAAGPSVGPPGEESPTSPAPAFGPQDPETRARRLARALVSDMKVYNPEKWEESRGQGTLRAEFRDEILKSWDEYVEQVGERMAKRTPHFRDALNEILAGGERVF